MIRTVVIGAVAAAVAMFIIGFIFFGHAGLSKLAHRERRRRARPRRSSRRWPRTCRSTGTYIVPDAERSPAQTVMYGQGPIATIHYNTRGFVGDGHGDAGQGLRASTSSSPC